jgi:hypothetical protein
VAQAACEVRGGESVASVHASIHTHFAPKRKFQNSYTYKQVLVRAAALAELRGSPDLQVGLGQRRLVRIRLEAPPLAPISPRAVASSLFFPGFPGAWVVPSGAETTNNPFFTLNSRHRLRRRHHALRLGRDFPVNREFAGNSPGIQPLTPSSAMTQRVLSEACSRIPGAQ